MQHDDENAIPWNATLLECIQSWDQGMSEDLLVDVPQRLLSKAVRKLQPGELQWLIAQGVGLPVVIPLAIEKLQAEPMLQAQSHPGDLLITLMESRMAYWLANHERWEQVIEVLTSVVETLQNQAPEEAEGYMPAYIGDDFMGALMHFRGIFKT